MMGKARKVKRSGDRGRSRGSIAFLVALSVQVCLHAVIAACDDRLYKYARDRESNDPPTVRPWVSHGGQQLTESELTRVFEWFI